MKKPLIWLVFALLIIPRWTLAQPMDGAATDAIEGQIQPDWLVEEPLVPMDQFGGMIGTPTNDPSKGAIVFFDIDGCGACMPEPIVRPPRVPLNWPPPMPKPGGGFPFDLGQILDLNNRQISPLVATNDQEKARRESFYAAYTQAMRNLTRDDLCSIVATAILAKPNEAVVPVVCRDGEVQVGEDVSVEATDGDDGNFTLSIAGKSLLLSKYNNNYESHYFHVIFATSLYGEPRTILFDTLPLYTTYNSIETIKQRGDGIVKYIDRSTDGNILLEFENRIWQIISDGLTAQATKLAIGE